MNTINQCYYSSTYFAFDQSVAIFFSNECKSRILFCRALSRSIKKLMSSLLANTRFVTGHVSQIERVYFRSIRISYDENKNSRRINYSSSNFFFIENYEGRKSDLIVFNKN